MCGIAGIFLFNNVNRSFVENIYAMGHAMRRRGPDDEGYLVVNDSNQMLRLHGNTTPAIGNSYVPYLKTKHINTSLDSSGKLFFAHRRLSIIDLSPLGHQPMCSSCGRYWIIYNGEIYNFKEIRRELASNSVVLYGNSDTEVLVNAYKTWGSDCLQMINGMFSFAIWDTHDESLFLARDRIGIKPLYYLLTKDMLLFASDIRTIIGSGLYTPSIDVQGLYYAMSFGIAPRPMTSFKDVLALEPAHYMTINKNGSAKKHRYWRFPENDSDDSLTLEDSINRIDQALQESVTRRLIADVPVGCFMSGGLDSTTVASIAGSTHNKISAYTIAFSDYPKMNEVEQAREVADKYNIDHHVDYIESDKVIDHIDNMISCFEEPYYSLAPSFLICRYAAERNAKVVLSGLGGDELFGGYKYYQWAKIWQILRMIPKIANSQYGVGPLRHIIGRVLSMSQANDPAKFALAVRSFFTETEKDRLFADYDVQEYDTVNDIFNLYVGRDRQGSFQEKVSYIDFANYISNHQVDRGDKFSMHHSLELRFPLLDHELLETVSSIPVNYRFSNSATKWLLRQIGKRYLPASCFEMKKKGFSLPMDYWMRTSLNNFVRDSLAKLSDRNIFDKKEILRTYQEWKKHLRSYRGVWQLVATELWLSKFIFREAGKVNRV